MATFLPGASGASGPDSMSPDSDQPSSARRLIACIACSKRKIKCSRVFPCANCIRTSTECIPGTPAPPRGRKPYNQALKSRLARCEQLLSGQTLASIASPTTVTTPKKSQSRSPVDPSPVSKWTPEGKLIEDQNGKVAFMDNYLLGLVNEELRAMGELINLDENERNSPLESVPSDPNADLLLGDDAADASLFQSWPGAALVFKLWQTFLDRVNPFTKVIHVHSVQRYVVEATNGTQGLPQNMVALLLSIFLMAVVAMTEEECFIAMKKSKGAAVSSFSVGIRQTMRRLDFMRTNDLVILQALCLYLYSLQDRYDRHSSWVFSGTVIRIAQKMGLHRDGDKLGLKPFESEMRRRVWWQLVSLDAKFALFSGFGHSLLPRDWDAREPSNLNDADIFPAATQPTPDRDGPSEMILCMIQHKITKFLVETPGLEPVKMMGEMNESIGASPVAGGTREQQMSYYVTHFELLEKSLQHLLDNRCNPHAGQVHVMAQGLIAALIKQKTNLIKSISVGPKPGLEDQSEADDAFKWAVSMLDHTAFLYAASENNGFSWFADYNFQYEVLLYVVVLLGQRLEGPDVQRAWENVEIFYRFRFGIYNVTEKSCATLAHFVLRAWSKRADLLTRSGFPPETPEYIIKLRARVDNVLAGGENTQGALNLQGTTPVDTEMCAQALPSRGVPPFAYIGIGRDHFANHETYDWSFLEAMAGRENEERPRGSGFPSTL
ncbi:fungal specific transcription factor domain-containing protein [Colletotrichum orchidophilum]|uniref:Fungal specific transcription factor domain-containing protein n=1 Tax=Colletotrichum orchidophilum TaxID=1209926 RepID=A0A1G4ATM0_9PEZI|nr:fungal specific transcription factor domain-containing protein [Colletotrichum orchidophilum]OHE92507.1 fungal specific transcription factor domain-containing protein [Colletotrichum orchidophilum]